MSEKEQEFRNVFNSHMISIDYLKKLCYGGIPSKYRAICWRILLGTHGLNIKNAERSVKQKNEKYLRSILGLENSTPGINTGESEHKHYFLTRSREKGSPITCRNLEADSIFLQTKNVFSGSNVLKLDEKHRHQIEIDIQRLASVHKKFLHWDISFLFRNILITLAIRRPAIGYVQGMADILTLFIHLFCLEDLLTAESSAFYTFSRFIDTVQLNFIDNQPGICQSFVELEDTIKISDRDLFDKFEKVSIRTHMYAFRWFNCFLTREFTLENAYLVFDSILSYGNPNRFVVFFGTSLLVFNREKILQMSFDQIMVFLQSFPTLEMNRLDMEMLFRLTVFLEKYIENV